MKRSLFAHSMVVLFCLFGFSWLQGMVIGSASAAQDDGALFEEMWSVGTSCPQGPQAASILAQWSFSLLNSGRCYLYHPPGWREWGNFYYHWWDGPESGIFTLVQLLQRGNWSAEAELQMALQMVRQRFPGLRVIGTRERQLPKEMGAGVRYLVAGFRMQIGGREAAGFVQLPYIPCSPYDALCTMTASGGWTFLPLNRSSLCQAVVAVNSLRCPPPGKNGRQCTNAQCNLQCQEKGYMGGRCQGDTCFCR